MSIEIRKPLKFQGDQKERGLARRSVEEVLKACAKDRVLLLSIVAGGMGEWMRTSGRAFKGFKVSDLQRELVFRTLEEQAGDDPKGQLDSLLRAELVGLKLDKLRGLARFIENERHLDEVLERNLPDDSERAAIRQQMLVIMRGGTVH